MIEIPNLTISSRITLEPSTSTLLKNLQPGQLLQATVLSDSTQNLVKLQIGTAELIARTQVSLRADQRITLDVIKGGEMPEMRVVKEPVIREFATDALRTILPKQIPMQRLYANLQAIYTNVMRSLPQPGGIDQRSQQPVQQPLATAPGSQPAKIQLPANSRADAEMIKALQTITERGTAPNISNQFGSKLIEAARNILTAAIPNSNNITPAQLRQAIVGYGLFMEAQLAAGQPPGNSLKGDLLQLLFQISSLLKKDAIGADPKQLAAATATAQTPTTMAMESGFIKLLEILFRQAEGGLARIHMNQLASLPPEDGARQVWQFEVPVRHQEHVDSFLIRLEQEQKTNNGKNTEHVWYATLTFNLGDLGPIKARISLNKDEVSTMFIAERAESAELLNRRIQELGISFSESGLNVGKLFVRQGNAEPEPEPKASDSPILDEKA